MKPFSYMYVHTYIRNNSYKNIVTAVYSVSNHYQSKDETCS